MHPEWYHMILLGLASSGSLGIFILFCLPEKYLGQMAGKMWAMMEWYFWKSYHEEREKIRDRDS